MKFFSYGEPMERKTNREGIAAVRSLRYSPDDSNPSKCNPCRCNSQSIIIKDTSQQLNISLWGRDPAGAWLFKGITAYDGVIILMPMDGINTIGGGDEGGFWLITL
jgi:hypothetical protein